jgi:AbrB family looped-hinge helix DNA binding protein
VTRNPGCATLNDQEHDVGTNGIGTTRQIDQLGRVVVPAALRRMLGINVGDTLEFTARGEELVLRRVAPSCAICGSDAEDLVDMHEKHVCQQCLREIRTEFSTV